MKSAVFLLLTAYSLLLFQVGWFRQWAMIFSDFLSGNVYLFAIVLLFYEVSYSWIFKSNTPSFLQKNLSVRFRHFNWILFILAIIIFTYPFLEITTNFRTDKCGFGYIPYSDNRDYLSAAYSLVETGENTAWGSRRPLNALFLSFRMWISGFDPLLALYLQCILLGTSSYLLSRTVAIYFGFPAGIYFFALLYDLIKYYSVTFMSEALGFMLGSVALSLVLNGVMRGALKPQLIGISAMTLALLTRAGAFFVIPCLTLGFIVLAAKGGVKRMCLAGTAIVSVGVLAFSLNALLNVCYSKNESLVGQGNFSHVLYGFSKGAVGWRIIYEDFPKVASLPEEQQNQFIYRQAIKNIKEEPLNLLAGFAEGAQRWLSGLARIHKLGTVLPSLSINFLEWILGLLLVILLIIAFPQFELNRRCRIVLLAGYLIYFILLLVTDLPVLSPTALYLLGAAGLLRYSWIHRKALWLWVLSLGVVGVILSGPIVFPDGGFRSLLATWPLFFIFIPMACAGLNYNPVKHNGDIRNVIFTDDFTEKGCIAILLIVYLGAIMGPLLIGFSKKRTLLINDLDANVLILEISPNMLHYRLHDDAPLDEDYPHDLKISAIKNKVSSQHFPFFEHEKRSDSGTQIIALGFNFNQHSAGLIWLVMPQAMMADKKRFAKVLPHQYEFADSVYFIEDFEAFKEL